MQAVRQGAKALRGSGLLAVGPCTARQPWLAGTGRSFAVPRARSASAPDSNDVAAQKAKALEAAMKEINAKCGAGTIMHFGSEQQQEQRASLPSGALTLDFALGGGWPEGKIIEIFGMESSGKSTLAMHAMAAAQKRGGYCALVDAENAFDKIYAKKLGMKLDHTFKFAQCNCGEDAFTTIVTLVQSGCFDVICVDSVAALTPRSEMEGDMGAPQVGTQARLMAQGLRKMNGIMSNSKTTVIFLNQIRHKIQAYGNPETTTGGNALKFFSSIRMKLSRAKGGSLLDSSGDERGIRVKAQVVKNKCAEPFKVAEFDILWASGISGIGCLLDTAEKVGVVSRKGSWYSYNNQNLAQGRDKTIQLIQQDEALTSKLDEETRKKIQESNMDDLFDARSSIDDDLPDEDLTSAEEAA